MANQTISQLPDAGPITGTELVPVVQNGGTYKTTTAALAGSPVQTQTFLTLNNEPTLNNSRYLSTDGNLNLTDGGAQSFLRINLTGAAESLNNSGNGFQVKTGLTTVVPRTITVNTSGIAIVNGDGVSGNPVISLTGQVLSLANASGAGLVALPNNGTVTPRSIVGVASEIDVTDGDGAAGDPTIGLADNPVVPGTGGMVLPSGNTAARPALPTNGVIRYNSQTDKFEGYEGGSWLEFGSGGGGSGTVTSVNVSGGTTGLTSSGGPITTSGTITLGGTLVAANGGTGQSSYAGGDILYASGATTLSKLGIGANTFLFSSNGSAPQWTDPSSVTVGNASNASSATNLAGGAANRLAYQSSAGTTSFVTAPVSSDTFLKWNGSAFVWSAISGAGTVTSVDASGGTTGLTFTGGPITSSGTLTLSGTLNVANGGTGATSLTGYVKGNGTSAFTASASIPNTDITGLGSMSTQNASSVSITGGSINGTTIGGTTAAAGTFTSVAMTTGTITTAPSGGNDIVNKTYADSIASGINFHQACSYATTAALPTVTYNNGTSGVGATLTATANGALVIDGYTFVAPGDNNKRVLIKNQSNQAHNGVYTVTQVGDGSNPFILTRATDFDSAGSGVDQIDAGDFFLVTNGTANANTSWVQQTPLPITVGTTAIVFTQFGAPITYSAGTGLSESPAYTFNIANTGVSSGNYGSASSVPALSVNAQGQITSATNTSIAIAANQITSGELSVVRGGTGIASGTSGGVPYFSGSTTIASSAALAANALVVGGGAGVAPSTITTGTGVVTALGINTDTAGAFVVNGGALGTPSSGTVTNLTGTASININGTVGATTPNTGAFTSVTSTSASGVLTRAAATQDGVELIGRAGGASSYKVSITPTTLSASRTLTLPDNDGTVLTTGATVTVSQGGTGTNSLTANNVILGNGTSAVQFVAPGTNGNVLTSNGTTWVSSAFSGVTTSANNAFTGANTFYNGTGQTFGTATSTQDGIILAGRAGGTTSLRVTVQPGTLTTSRTLTLPDNSGTVLTTGATVTVAQGGTGISSGTSGGVPYFSSTSAIASSAALAANALVIGGGAGNAPATTTTGTGVLTALGNATNATGGVVTVDGTATLTNKTLTDPAIIGAIIEDIFTITDGAAFEVNPGNGTIQLITLGANRTPKATNFAAGESVTLMVNDGTAYTITWTDATWGSGGVVWVGGVAPTLATTGYTVIEFWKVSTQVYGALVGSVA